MLGTLLNHRYRLDAELGRGGMGLVFQGYDVYLQRAVAVKVLSEGGLGTEGRGRLLNEARSAAQLNHPNIVSVFDAGETGDLPFVVMELIEGETLYDRRPESVEDILAAARQVCAALEHAHSHGIVHRDLKPENILVTPEGIAKLTDFGLARSFASRLTSEGSITGTVYYLAPELALGRPFDGRADLYALGVLLYELVAGRLPFQADNPLAVVSQHVHAPVVPPSTYRPDLPLGLEAVILKLMAKDPELRYATAGAAGEALEGLDAGGGPAVLGAAELDDERLLLEKLARGRLIGRQAEMDALHRLWRRALGGQATLALISGEPGVGKTRLANEMIVYARLGGAEVLRGGCYEYEAATPYLPFVEALRAWVHQASGAELRRLEPLAPELAKLAPEIGDRLGPLAANPPLPPGDERLRLFDHVARFLALLAAGQGLLLFIDDIHWADAGALALLHYLLRHLRSERLMVVACYREVELDRQHPFAASLVEWNREHLGTRLILGRLAREDVRALLMAFFGQETISDEFTDAILRETEGNPFFIEEVIKALIEQGGIYREDGRWQRRELDDLAIPQSVKEAIGRRLDRQSAGCLAMLHTAAALGKRFAFSDLAAASEGDENALLDYLDEASHAQLIRPESDDEYVFTHDKIREVLYEELNPIRRRRLHLRIGAALEQRYQSEQRHSAGQSLCCSYSPVETLAYHFVEGGDLERGLHYSEEAARSAAAVFAHDEAIHYYERAIEAAEALGRRADQARLLHAIGRVYYDRGSYAVAIAMYQHALGLAVDAALRLSLKIDIGNAYAQMGDGQGVPYLEEALTELDAEAQPLELARVHAYLGRFHHLNAEWDHAREHLERALALAEPLDDVIVLCDIYTYLSGVYQWTGEFERSIAWARKNIELGERTGYLNAVAIGNEFIAEDYFSTNRWLEALEYAETDRRIGQKIGSLSRIAWAENAFASAYLGLGNLRQALEHANECVRIVQTTGEERLEALARSTRAQTYAQLGEFEAATEDADYVRERAKTAGHQQVLIWSYRAWVQIYFTQERWEELYALLQAAPETIQQDQADAYLLACMHLDRDEEVERLAAQLLPGAPLTDPAFSGAEERSPWEWFERALLAQYRRDRSTALGYFQLADTGFEQRQSWLGQGLTLYRRAGLQLAASALTEAQRDVERAIELLERCEARPDLLRAQGLLAVLQARRIET